MVNADNLFFDVKFYSTVQARLAQYNFMFHLKLVTSRPFKPVVNFPPKVIKYGGECSKP